MKLKFSLIIIIWSCLLASGCGSSQSNQNAAQDEPPKTANTNIEKTSKKSEPSHEHHAPHGGTLVEIGEEFAHLELVLDSENGKLTGYVLDGEAEKSVRISQLQLEIEINEPKPLTVRLLPVENSLTGEKEGATSEFSLQADDLRELSNFDGIIKVISIKGTSYTGIKFNFPEGNETKHK